MSRVDSKEWRKAIKTLSRLQGKTAVELVNKKHYFAMRRALKETPAARREHIERDLGVTGYKLRKQRATGKLVRGASQYGARAYQIYKSKHKGKRMSRSEVEKGVRQMVGNAFRSVGTLRAGYRGILKPLSYAAKELFPSISGPRVKRGGKAKAAKEGGVKDLRRSESTYQTVDGWGRFKGQVNPHVIAAIERAVAIEVADTVKFAEQKLAANARQAGF